MGRLPEAWIAPPEIRELRELSRYRHKLVKLRTSCKDQVHGVLAKLGIAVPCSDIFGVRGSTWLAYLTGKLEILRIREEARGRLGPAFSLAAFHAAVLDHGSLPMPTLARSIAGWLDRAG